MEKSRKLNEILVKIFQNRDTWSIDAMKLAKKIPINEKYPSHIVRKIESKVNKINKHYALKIDLSVRRPRRGKAILTFRKI